MLKKIWCFLWGHKVVVKRFTGKTFPAVNPLTGADELGHYYGWERLPFCLRCGKEVKN